MVGFKEAVDRMVSGLSDKRGLQDEKNQQTPDTTKGRT